MKRLIGVLAALMLILACVTGSLGCGMVRRSSPPPPPASAPDMTGASALGEPKVAEKSHEPTETCEGALNCTFFGVGAVLAAPFWVLGTVLGLTL